MRETIRTNRWPTLLLPTYQNLKLLVCSSDPPNPYTFGQGDITVTNLYPADAAPRSYIINGWNDYFLLMASNNWANYRQGRSTQVMPETFIREPSDTAVFGEKESWSGHYYMDYEMYDDIDQLDQGKHSGTKLEGAKTRSGGSNYIFADGSARFIKYPRTFSPLNLWAVTDLYRQQAVVIP